MKASTAASVTETLERATLRKVYLRLVPFCFLLYILCYIDRINVSFAALTMNKELGLSGYIYGLAAGAFFWGYCLLEVPSNLIMESVGARIWLTRIMVSWGLLSAATAFVVGPWSFFIVRVLLGIAEAGLFPGILLYFHRWFPQHHRARVVGGFLIGIPLSAAIGSPLSTAFMQLDGVLDLHGWQWVFLGEGMPTALIGVSVWFLLTERPRDATWLAPEQRAWLVAELEQERRADRSGAQAFDPVVDDECARLGAHRVVGGISMSAIGLVLFMPQILKGLGVSNTQAGLLTAVPYLFGTIAMVACAMISDHTKDRYWIADDHLRVRGVGPGDGRGHAQQPGLGAGGVLPRHCRFLRHEGGVLGDAFGVPHRIGSGCRPRLHQLDRQFCRISRPHCGGLYQRSDRQLRGGNVRARGRCRGLGGDGARLRALDAAHCGARRGAGGRIGALIRGQVRRAVAAGLQATGHRGRRSGARAWEPPCSGHSHGPSTSTPLARSIST